MNKIFGIAAVAAIAIFATEKAMAQELVKAPVVNKVGQYTWVQEYIGTETV